MFDKDTMIILQIGIAAGWTALVHVVTMRLAVRLAEAARGSAAPTGRGDK